MADVIELPTAAREPVINQRRPGSYGRKIVSFQSAQRRARADAQRGRSELDQRPAERENPDGEPGSEKRHQAAQAFYAESMRRSPLQIACLIEEFTPEQRARFLTTRLAELTYVGVSIQLDLRRAAESDD